MSDRIPCCIEGCKCTVARDKFPNTEEIICKRHYAMADGRVKSAHKLALARCTKIYRLSLKKKYLTGENKERIRKAWNTAARRETLAWGGVKLDVGMKVLFCAPEAETKRDLDARRRKEQEACREPEQCPGKRPMRKTTPKKRAAQQRNDNGLMSQIPSLKKAAQKKKQSKRRTKSSPTGGRKND